MFVYIDLFISCSPHVANKYNKAAKHFQQMLQNIQAHAAKHVQQMLQNIQTHAMICFLFSLKIIVLSVFYLCLLLLLWNVVIYSFVQIMFTTWPHVANKKEWCCKACSPNVAKKWTKLQSMCTKCCKKWTKLQSMFTKCCKTWNNAATHDYQMLQNIENNAAKHVPNVAKHLEQCCKACLPNVAKHWGQCCKACSPNVAKNEQSCKACLPHVAKHWTMLKNMFAKCCKTFKFRAMLQSMFTECCKTFRQSNEQCCKALPSPGYLPLCLILEYYISLLISNSVQPWNNTNINLMT